MLSGIAHELRNPLSIISARSQMALKKVEWDREWAIKNFESIDGQVNRCATIINSLLDYTRYRATQPTLHKVDEVLDETLTYVEYQNIFDAITVEKDYQGGLVVFGDRSRFVQIFLNIVLNAADAMSGRACSGLPPRPKARLRCSWRSTTPEAASMRPQRQDIRPVLYNKGTGKGNRPRPGRGL